jgi:hypothetical protein
MGFAMLPPEINSPGMYAGRGPASLLAARRLGIGWPPSWTPRLKASDR